MRQSGNAWPGGWASFVVSTSEWVDAVRRLQAGDDGPAADLVRRFGPLARATASRLVNTAADVDDVVQDSFVEAFATIHQLRTAEAFPAWLRLIVRKRADRLRRAVRPTEPLSSGSDWSSGAPGPDVIAEHREVAAAVRLGLSMLAVPDRRLLELRYLAGWTIAELADLTGAQPGTVRKRLHAARARLRPSLRHLQETPMTDYETFLGHIHTDTAAVPPAAGVVRPEPLEAATTGLAVIDTIAPVARGGTVEFAGPAGSGQVVMLVELAYRLTRGETEAAVIGVGTTVDLAGAFGSFTALIDDVEEHDRHAVFLVTESGGAVDKLNAASNLANGLAAAGIDVLLAVDRATLDLTGQRPQALAGLAPSGGSVTAFAFNVVPRDQPLPAEVGCDTRIVFSRDKVALGEFPAIDPVNSNARFADSDTPRSVRSALETGRRLRAFFAQPLRVAEAHTGEPSTWVEPAAAAAELQALLRG